MAREKRERAFISPGLINRAFFLCTSAAPYITPKKVLNLLRCEAEQKNRIPKPRSYPYIAVVDVSNMCNLSCLYCPTGRHIDSGRKKWKIEIPVVQRLITEMGQNLISANLFNWGEPLLHPRIADIVRMFHEARIWTSISSNLSIRKTEVLDDICDAGLDYMVVSLSGASQGVHEKYHRRSNIELVMENSRRIMQYRKRNRVRKPVVEWKFLVFKHNRHEVKAARKLAKKIGVDLFRWFRAGGAAQDVLEDGQAPERKVRLKSCHQLWHTVVVNADQGVAPCCFLFFKEDDFGDYEKDTLMSIRNNSLSVTARSLFNASCVSTLPDDLRLPCLKCELVHEQPHLHYYLKSNPFAVKDHRTGGP